jgi:sulfide dehydrogenase [flavocytochrome c] flavoprotein chain
MNQNLNVARRRFTKGLGASSALSMSNGITGVAAGLGAFGVALSGCTTATPAPSEPVKKLGRVLVVGAGFGGATAAKYLKEWGGAGIEVLLVDRQQEFVSCPMSNLVLGGSKTMSDITASYEGLRRRGVIVANDEVLSIDAAKKRASFNKLADQSFDHIIISPGVDFDYGTIQGYDAEAQKTVLSAWKAGAETVALRAQLEAMPDGGVYLISIPTAPYRCPPGPYERACQVAYYFKTHKPRSKVIILDANPDIVSKAGLFKKAFNEVYKGLIEYRPNSKVTELDAKGKSVTTELGDKTQASVLNVLPQMSAGKIARAAGLVNANNRWCAVDWITMESTAASGVHVLGDATLSAALMPKSGHMANQHGKAAASAIVEMLNGRAPTPSMMANTCYSFIDNSNVVHVASVHRYVAEKKTMEVVTGASGLSSEANALEGVYANAWAQNIWNDMLS